jgi:short-subunit dehydrogenase
MSNGTPDSKGKVLLGLGVAAGVVTGLAAWRHLIARRYPLPRSARGEAGTAAITGASSGIGAAFARRLAASGYDLILVARREERLTALARELEQHHLIQVEILTADLASKEDVESVERRVAQLDNLAFLINSAGFGTSGKFASSDLTKQIQMIEVHVLASVRLSRAALPAMIARQAGAIINLSSVISFVPAPGNVTYCATKTYLNVFSQVLHTELSGTGVRVQALCPGLTHTEFHDSPEFAAFHSLRIPEALWMSADEVVSHSLECLRRNKVICVPGFKNRIMGATLRQPLVASMLQQWFRGVGNTL